MAPAWILSIYCHIDYPVTEIGENLIRTAANNRAFRLATTRIDDRLNRLINAEEARPFTDYAFLNVAGDSSANLLQRSPLSTYPDASEIPGLIGYFQVDAQAINFSPCCNS